MITETNKSPLVETISLPKNYDSISDLFNDARPLIFAKIIIVFNELLSNDEVSSGISVDSNVNGQKCHMFFGFDKNQPEILIKVILPYYKEMEEYEMCAEILKLYNKLK